MKKILLIVAPINFRDEEALIPKQLFEEKGFSVVVASKNTSIARGSLGAKLNVDLNTEQINQSQINQFDAIVFSGGAGALIYFEDKNIHNLIQTMFKNNKLIAAICIGPMILAKAGILDHKKATVWDKDLNQSKYFLSHNIHYTNQNVVVDKNIITANGPHAAQQFANKIIEMLL